MTKWSAAGCLLVLGLSACDSDRDDTNIISSNNVTSNTVFATYQVSATGDGSVDVYSQFQLESLDSNTYVDLAGGDEIWITTGGSVASLNVGENLFQGLANVGNNFQRLERNRATRREEPNILERIVFLDLFGSGNEVEVGEVWYAGRLNNDAADTNFRFELLRNSQGQAGESRVILPDTFAITAPAANEVYDPVNDLMITWEPANPQGMMDIRITPTCSGSPGNIMVFDDQADTGSFTLPGNSFSLSRGVCSYTIQLNRTHNGSLDPALAGGVITATQVRRRTIQ